MLNELNDEERRALRAAAEALVIIRQFSRGPISEENRKIINDLADAFHNIPELCAAPAAQREANSFLLRSGIEQAQIAYRHHGIRSSHLPPLSIEVKQAIVVEGQTSSLVEKFGHLPGRIFAQLFKPVGTKQGGANVVDYWRDTAAKLRAEMDAGGVGIDASDEEIRANAGEWFSNLPENTKAATIRTMRGLSGSSPSR